MCKAGNRVRARNVTAHISEGDENPSIASVVDYGNYPDVRSRSDGELPKRWQFDRLEYCTGCREVYTFELSRDGSGAFVH